MPENQPIPQPLPEEQLSVSSQKENKYGLAALAFVGIATFFLVYAYASERPAESSQVASAVESLSISGDLVIEANSALVVELNTGKILFSKNADAPLPLASLAKVPLALAVSEVLLPDDYIIIPYDTAFTEGGQRLLRGEKWTVRDILHFTLIASSNESAQILADAADAKLHALYPSSVAGEAALWRMNDLVKSLGLAQTHFINVNGLDASETQSGGYGTARDMARLFAYAATVKSNIFAGTTKNGLLLTDTLGGTTSAFNTNQILGDIPGLIMGKTGFTDLAGGNLVVVFDAGLSQPVVAVVLGSSKDGRFRDMRTLVSAARASISHE